MGVYVRPNSPFYWLRLERPKLPGLREPTKIPKDATTAFLRKEQRQQAEDAYIARMRELAAARYDLPPDTEPDIPTFQAFSVWYETQHTARKRGAIREGYILTRLRDSLGPLRVTAITPAVVQEYITARLALQNTPSTVNREVDLLKAMLKAAVGRGHLKASPLAGMKKLRVVPKRKKVLSQAEEDRVLAELHPPDRALYILAVDTLLRLGNLLDLRWTDVTKTHIVLEDSKTGPYQVPLSTRAKAVLASLTNDGPYVFPHRRTAATARDRRGGIRRMLQRACARAGVPYGRNAGGVTFHTATRASGATRMLRAGADPRTVQAVGHWRDFRSMQEYLQTDDRLMREAVNQIGAKSTAVIPCAPRVHGDRQKPSKPARTRRRASVTTAPKK